MTPDLLRLLRRIAGPVLAITFVLSGVGLALDRWPGSEWWPYEASGSWRIAARSVVGLGAASAALPILVVAGMRVGYRRWRESAFLVCAMVVAALALTISAAVVPGTSFPPAATGMATATYGAISVVLGRRGRTPWRRRVGAVAPWLLVLTVAACQLSLREYRPEEVGASLLAALAAIGVATRYVLLGRFEQRPAPAEPDLSEPRRRAAVIVNPTKVTDMAEERLAVTAFMAASGWVEPLWLETRLDELGVGHAKQAAAEGVDVVFACGGDGTIMSVLTGLAGTGVPLAILPAGTGNLLARNLELPQDRDACLRIGTAGADRKIDVGRVDEMHRFAVMAGMGLDAAMIMDAPPKLKARIGWPAYAVSAIKHIFDRRMHVTITVDDAAPVELRARGVVIGNVGRLQAGMLLMPDAVPDDGILDVAVLVPKTLRHWLVLSGHVIARRPGGARARIVHFRGRRIHIKTDRPEPREIDGDLLEPGTEMLIVVEPQALIVRISPALDTPGWRLPERAKDPTP